MSNNKDISLLDDEIDNALVPLKLKDSDEEIINAIVAAESRDELQTQFDLFNINQSKKNALRMIKLESLLNKVEDQAIERFEKHPHQVSNRELLDYMQIVSAQIDRSQKVVDSLKEKELIRPIQQNTEVTINVGTELDRDSKANVVSAIKGILGMLRDQTNNIPPTLKVPEETDLIQPINVDILENEEE